MSHYLTVSVLELDDCSQHQSASGGGDAAAPPPLVGDFRQPLIDGEQYLIDLKNLGPKPSPRGRRRGSLGTGALYLTKPNQTKKHGTRRAIAAATTSPYSKALYSTRTVPYLPRTALRLMYGSVIAHTRGWPRQPAYIVDAHHDGRRLIVRTLHTRPPHGYSTGPYI